MEHERKRNLSNPFIGQGFIIKHGLNEHFWFAGWKSYSGWMAMKKRNLRNTIRPGFFSGVLIGFGQILSFATARESKDNKPPETAKPYTLTISGRVDPAMAPVAGQMATLFYQSYPRLVERFGNPKKPAPTQIELVFAKDIKVPAYCIGSKITVSIEWLTKHPEDVGLLTHELTHAVQAYPRSEPGWFTEGLADYARHLYGPREQPNWALPAHLTDKQSYKDSYRVTGKFLLWLDGKYPGVVDKLHRKMQDREFVIEDFKTLTGKTIDELWEECVGK